ncbi:ATP-binding protein [Aliarcobacter butzleri]|uniref:ATP-binding protein n=1 Tax=Aliarcobacter butzleri TaxID=28197 RepID=UPI00189D5127|nr:AAA family ATPase [Aliarcobacter butzleri]MBF7064805.1 AAA family ATPase [Aliarcobacter butzleri]MCG3659789.1 AAA family ATPase [Aliarcobacter butzleri]MCG3700656.1 AAA family ATPase [Aliarcobacter butzleri]
MDLHFLQEEQEKLLHNISLEKKRYLYHKINWELKSIAILGQRGLGKTTLMLQYIKENFSNSNKALYISLDTFYFQSISLYEFAKEFEQNGGEILFIDEVHKYNDWSLHIKNIYDLLNIRVVFTGSSILQISKQNADLSRRSVIYHLDNLSFREYLFLSDILDYRNIDINEILSNHTAISSDISKTIKPLQYFKEYLEYGVYPFILEDKNSYHQKIVQMINLILETDLSYIKNIEVSQINKIKKLLYMLAVNVPFIPNITQLANSTNISRPKVYEYLQCLEEAKIINSLRSKEKGYNIMSKPEKLFMQNTNISYAITSNVNIGSVREAFFVNQIKNYYSNKNLFLDESIFLSKQGDFLVDNLYIFEIGGKNKDFSQIKDIENSFVVSDDIEIGFKNKIPLWLFGFLY